MATNNAVNCKDSGIVSYNGAGTFSALANPLTVSNGGSGVSSTTAYAVLCGGSTGSGNIQSIASVGTSGQVLTSNGASALPTFQTPSSGGEYVLVISTASGNPADSTTYYLANGASLTNETTVSQITKFYIPADSTINSVYGNLYVDSTLGSAQNCTLAIRVNDTTDTNLTTTLTLNNASTALTFTSIGLSVSSGDYITLKFVGAAWTTNPLTVHFSLSIHAT